MIDGADELAAEFTRAADVIDMRVSVRLIAAAHAGQEAAKMTVQKRSGATAESVTVENGRGRSPSLGDTELVVGADQFDRFGRMSAAGFLAMGTSKMSPRWDFFGQVEKKLQGLERDVADEVDL